MRLQIYDKTVTVKLNRKDLETLLGRLDAHDSQQACTLIRDFNDGRHLIVVAENHHEHHDS